MKQSKQERAKFAKSLKGSSIDKPEGNALIYLQRWLMLIADEIARDLVATQDKTDAGESHSTQLSMRSNPEISEAN